jgi:hypothetical protein
MRAKAFESSFAANASRVLLLLHNHGYNLFDVSDFARRKIPTRIFTHRKIPALQFLLQICCADDHFGKSFGRVTDNKRRLTTFEDRSDSKFLVRVKILMPRFLVRTC